MPFKIIRPDHYELLGEGYVLLTAPHATGPEADLHTGQIVEDAALTAKCYAVIGKVSREYLDLNRIQAAHTEFRKSIDGLVQNNGIMCMMDIHGKKDPGVDVGTAGGETASVETTDLVRARLSRDFVVKVNAVYMGVKPGSIITTYARRESSGRFALEALQLEFGHEERHQQRGKLIDDIAELATLLNRMLGPNNPDEH